MPLLDVALCLVACLLWAGNFIAVKLGLDAQLTPFLLTACRFVVASCLLPLVPPPRGMRWSWLALIGLVIGVGQFGLATLSVAAGLPAGIVALVLQSQVLFTIALAAGVLREAISRRIILGGLVALVGVGLLVHAGDSGAAQVSVLGLLLGFAAAAAAALGNVLIRRLAGSGDPLRLAVWISPFPVVPLLGLSCLTEASPLATLARIPLLLPGLVVLYGGIVSAVGGTAIWASLLRRHPASRVALFSPSIPAFAFALSAIVFGERPGVLQLGAIVLVVLGLLIATVGGRVFSRNLVRLERLAGYCGSAGVRVSAVLGKFCLLLRWA